MAKSKKLDSKSDSHHHGINLRKLSACRMKFLGDAHHEKRQTQASSEDKQWKRIPCSVCLEYPHNAVLLLCSSYDKGCRPYMCATSHRYSNCLEQYRKAYTKAAPDQSARPHQEATLDIGLLGEPSLPDVKAEMSELLCPLCRGQVKGWTVVEHARKYFNAKKRACMADDCSYIGNYKELKKHVKMEHPLARPREVNPSHVEKWKKLESERELSDVFSTIRSTMPGAIVIGDYVIERGHHGFPARDFGGNDYLDTSFFRFPAFGNRWSQSRAWSPESFEGNNDPLDDNISRLRARVTLRRHRINASRVARPRERLWVASRARRHRGGR